MCAIRYRRGRDRMVVVFTTTCVIRYRRGRDRMVVVFTTTCVIRYRRGRDRMVVVFTTTCVIRYRRGRDRMVVVFTTTCAIGVPITTKVVSSNPAHGEVYSIQHFFLSLSGTYDRSVVFSEYSGFLHQNN